MFEMQKTRLQPYPKSAGFSSHSGRDGKLGPAFRARAAKLSAELF
jgi:hypothetical protein